MSLATAPLPTDFAALQAFAASLQAQFGALEEEIAARNAEIHAQALHIEKLKMQLAQLRRARFGQSSEKLDREIEQLELLIDELEEGQGAREEHRQAAPVTSASAGATPARGKPVRQVFPDHLPCEIVEHPAACVCPECGGTRLSLVGTEIREVLERVPATLKVIQHRYPKVSCRDCQAITQPSRPSLPIERGMAGPNLLAHVLVSKYCDHQPLYRQSAMFAREGIELDRSTLCGWVGSMASLLSPVVEAVARHVREGPVLHADDTPVPVLQPGRGKTKTGRLWVALRDERPWGSGVPPAVLYRYSSDRKSEQAEALLAGCRGYLHADGYSGFNTLYRPGSAGGEPRLREVACWAHARRKLFEVHAATQSPAAREMLETIGRLFTIEERLLGQPPETRRQVRSEQAVPLLDQLREHMDATLAKVSRKLSLAAAIRYALTRWEALCRYTIDGRLEISNNAAERAIRPLALGRKNWMFAGSDAGGERAATL